MSEIWDRFSKIIPLTSSLVVSPSIWTLANKICNYYYITHHCASFMLRKYCTSLFEASLQWQIGWNFFIYCGFYWCWEISDTFVLCTLFAYIYSSILYPREESLIWHLFNAFLSLFCKISLLLVEKLVYVYLYRRMSTSLSVFFDQTPGTPSGLV